MVTKTIRYKKNPTPSTVINFRNLVIIMRISTFKTTTKEVKKKTIIAMEKRNKRMASRC